MAIALLAVTGTAGLVGAGRTATLTLVLGSAVAVLVAVAVGERWRRRAWLAGGLAGVGAAGQGLAVITGALLVGEPLVSQPGVGDLLIRSLTTHDGNVVAAAATTLLIFALVGQLVGALAGTFSDRLDAPASPAEPERSGVLTTFRVAAAATLILPLLALAGSLLAGSTTNFDLEHVSMGPSLIHLLGTDSFGRDLLARLLISFRSAWLVTLGGLLLAAVLGLIWAGLAVLLERKWPRGGRLVAEVLLAPGRLMMVAPLLLAAVVLVGADRWPAVLAFAVILTPRLAAAIVSLARPFPASVPSAIRATGGLLLTAWGIALIVLVGQQFVGVGVTPPAPALGGLLSERVQYLVIGAGQALLVALATILLTAPFLLAGWALLRQPPRADVLTTLDT
jgi:ABC-type dipeptide/oligopeptide/nickel transport system permease subunit